MFTTAMSTLIGAQIRAARAMLGWSLADLAQASGVSLSTIRRAEAGMGVLNITLPNLNSMRIALKAAGIEFIGTPDHAPGIRIHSLAKD